jgi:hypothetical protein
LLKGPFGPFFILAETLAHRQLLSVTEQATFTGVVTLT